MHWLSSSFSVGKETKIILFNGSFICSFMFFDFRQYKFDVITWEEGKDKLSERKVY